MNAQTTTNAKTLNAVAKRHAAYLKRQGEIQDEAIRWQNDFIDNDYSYGELADYAEYFTKMGRRYGLLKEFRENGII